MSEQLIQTPGVFGDNGNFLLERELGSGGMGGVYMGRDKMLDRPVAVKVMLKEYGSDAEFVEKFKKEAQSAARLIHPNIAQIYSYGISDGMPYIAMELASGGSLYSIMNANPGKTDIARVLKICQQVAQALQCSSDQGFVHGDVKPENVLLDANGNAKLVDFGLAAMQKDTSEIWGTPYYISPEKVKKEAVDFRADMYSLGGTLYHALTGVAPFEGDDSIAVIKKRFEAQPRKPSEIRPELTPAIDALVMKMLALDKNDRYPSFEALIQAFKDVLTTGLTAKVNDQQLAAGAAKPTPAGQSGARRMTTVRGGRRVMMKRPGMATSAKSRSSAKDDDIPDLKDESEEEGGGNLGAKVALFVVGGILLVGGVIGGLVWYQIADKKAREEERRQMILGNIVRARQAIGQTRDATVKFNDEFADFAKTAENECSKFTVELQKLLPDFANEMKPPISAELQQAIALTNEVPKADAATTNAPAAVAAAAQPTNAPAAAAEQPAAPRGRLSLADEAKKYGIPPPPEDFDPASPEGEEFLAKLKEARQKAASGATVAKEEPKAEEAPAATEPEKAEEAKKVPPAVTAVMTDIKDLWERTYSCQASIIKVSVETKKVLEECAQADELKDESETVMNQLGELSQTVKNHYDQITSSKDVENVRKGISYIKSKGKKAVETTIKELDKAAKEAKRQKEKEDEIAREKERLRKIEEARLALVEKEQTSIAARFDEIAAHGCFRQLDWKSAYRMLNDVSQNFKTPEGELAAKNQVKKVNRMKAVQDLFIKHLKGYVFKGKLKGAQVLEPTEKDILILKADGKKKQRIIWQTFYSDYPGNFNEIINYFILHGRKNISLNLKDWGDAMIGAALTMKLVCSEVNGALERSEQLAKEVLKQFPEYEKDVHEAFPGVEADAKEEE